MHYHARTNSPPSQALYCLVSAANRLSDDCETAEARAFRGYAALLFAWSDPRPKVSDAVFRNALRVGGLTAALHVTLHHKAVHTFT